jgi:hypothetical protein
MRRRHSGADEGRRGHAGAAALAGTLALLLLTSCSTGSLFGSSQAPAPQSPSPSFGQRISGLFSGGSADTTGAQTAGLPGQEFDCPVIDVRAGASTYSVNSAGGEPSAMGLRYQGTLGQSARECAFLGATMTVKVGVQGRIVLGPAGVPGPVEVPLRLALVHEGPEPKTVWTKFYKIPVAVQPGQNNVAFTHIEPDLTIPMPPADNLGQYVIYVGFDPLGLKQPPERKPRPPALRR